ncbi:MAG: hypothetical protein HYU97_09400 [Deltaproteobacteria bacterium]|nr:hypothetical protein [Deltaproteobacteria bacterium]
MGAPEFKKKAEFYQINPTTYWADLDGDGKQGNFEKFTIKPGENRVVKAQEFIKQNPSTFWDFIEWEPTFKPAPNFNHPEKTTLSKQINLDIAALEKMQDRPKIYDELLADLKLIQEELPYVKFRYPNEGEVPEGFIGIYDPINNEMIVTAGAPASLLIHETDHLLTEKRRNENWSVEWKLKCDNGHKHTIPKSPHAPSPNQVRTKFSFNLDFAQQEIKTFTYDSVVAWSYVLKTLEMGSEICLGEVNKQVALANEVRGYMTMARYLLFRIGFTEQQLGAYQKGGFANTTLSKAFIEVGLQHHLEGSNLNYRWANAMVVSYLDGKLDVFVKAYYTDMAAPGFVDQPGCARVNE